MTTFLPDDNQIALEKITIKMTTRHAFVKHDAPGGDKVKYGKVYILPRINLGSMWCQWCGQSLAELTVKVYLMYHYSNL